MNKPAVTKAQLTRTVQALEAMGKPVGAVEILPDGRVHLLLGAGLAPVEVAPDDEDERELREFRRGHGYG